MWEYKEIVGYMYDYGNSPLMQEVAAHSDKGWELVTILGTVIGGYPDNFPQSVAILKRDILIDALKLPGDYVDTTHLPPPFSWTPHPAAGEKENS